MLKKTSFDLLCSFSKPEWKEFIKFVSSSYYNTNLHVVRLAKYVNTALMTKKYNKVERKAIFAYLYPEKEYNDVLMRKLFSLLNVLSEQFVVTESIKKQTITSKRIFVNELCERNLMKLSDKHIENAVNSLNKNKKNENIYLEYYLFDYLNSQVKSHLDIMYVQPHKNVLKHLINYFSYSYLKITAYNCIRENLTNEKFENTFVEHLFNLANKGYFDKEIPVLIFLDIVRLFATNDTDKNELFKRVDKYDFEKYLSGEDCLYAYFFILQYLVIEGIKGVKIKDYKVIKWKYYKKYSEYAAIRNDVIGQTTFGNIINAAAANGDIRWAEDFIKKYRHLVHSEDENSFWETIEARLCIAKKDHTSALSLLSKSNPKTYVLKDTVRIFTVICLYELNRFEELFFFLESYKKFLINSDSKYPKLLKKETSEFLKTLELIVKLRFAVEKLEKDKLEIKLKKMFTKKIIFLQWLKEKIFELTTNK